jgi:hypothetical protein
MEVNATPRSVTVAQNPLVGQDMLSTDPSSVNDSGVAPTGGGNPSSSAQAAPALTHSTAVRMASEAVSASRHRRMVARTPRWVGSTR